MDSEAWKALFQQGLPTVLVIGGAMFFAFRIWPWWSLTYLPEKLRLQEESDKRQVERDIAREASIVALREAMSKLTDTTAALQGSVDRLPSAIVAATSSMLREQSLSLIEVSQDRLFEHEKKVLDNSAQIMVAYERSIQEQVQVLSEELKTLKASVDALHKAVESALNYSLDKKMIELEEKLIGFVSNRVAKPKEDPLAHTTQRRRTASKSKPRSQP